MIARNLMWLGTLACGFIGYFVNVNGGYNRLLTITPLYKTKIIYQTNTFTVWDIRHKEIPYEPEQYYGISNYFMPTNITATTNLWLTNDSIKEFLYITNITLTNWFMTNMASELHSYMTNKYSVSP